jgi:threonine aldolase
MNFASDNVWGVAEPVMAALRDANEGAAGAYGGDDLTRDLEVRFGEIFECDVSMYLVPTGTAANALAAAAYCPPYGMLFCHDESHIYFDECGASEFYTGGAKLMPIASDGGIIDPDVFADIVKIHMTNPGHCSTPAMFSLTQATEFGRVYAPGQIAALTAIARDNGLATHMDGARFANALVSVGCSPAEMTWKAGIDALSFGATKNGVMGADALLFFDGKPHEGLASRLMRGGLLMSKSRFLAAQLIAYLADNLWLDLAKQANGTAKKLADGLSRSNCARLVWPVSANEIFAVLPVDRHEKLKAAGAIYHPWMTAGPSREKATGADEILVRLVTSPSTPENSVDEFLAILAG